MTSQPGPEMDELDVERPNPARMYDYLLGGAANFAADRAAVDEVLRLNPQGRAQTHANRAFLRRAVRHLVDAGVRQFLDLGSGVPTVGHVHEIAQAAAPDARVVYVENEPVAHAYSRQLLHDVPNTAVLSVDLRNTSRVLEHPDLRALLDLDQPVAVLMFAVLHFIQDDAEAAQLVASYRDHTVPGSYLAISHACADANPMVGQVAGRYQQTTMPFRTRTRAEVTALFDGYTLLDPGVQYLDDWRPDDPTDPDRPTPAGACGVGIHR